MEKVSGQNTTAYEVWYEDKYGSRKTSFSFSDRREARTAARGMNDSATRSRMSIFFYVVEVAQTRLEEPDHESA